jgi:hypothetical protein
MVLEMLTAHVSLWTKDLRNIKVREDFRIDTTPGPAAHSQPYRAGQAVVSRNWPMFVCTF